MPLEFLKRRGREPEPPPTAVLPEETSAQEHVLKLYYAGKSSEAVRMKAGPRATAELPNMLTGLVEAGTEVEVVEPRPVEYAEASPYIIRPSQAMQWVNAHHANNPVTRHSIYVLEMIDAIDLAFDTLVCGLIDGEVDTSGYPEYDAIVGGIASHWDESTGDMLVRAVLGWGGRGARGDTDRTAGRLLAGIFKNIQASQFALGVVPLDRPMPAAGRGGLVCAHCGFASAHQRAFYCPKCGMRLLRG